MPGVSRDNGQDTAGGLISQGSPDVYVENKPAVRKGDLVSPHGNHSTASMAAGSPNVYVNNLPVCREGDVATCGHVATGSSTVFAN